MELIHFHCPSCHHRLVVPPEAAARSGPCPDCGVIIHGPNSPGARLEETAPERPPAETPEPVAESPPEEASATPAKKDEPPREHPQPEATNPPRSGLSLPLVFTLVFLSSALFFALGFFIDKSAAPSDAVPSPASEALPPPADEPSNEQRDTSGTEPTVNEAAVLPSEESDEKPAPTGDSAAARATLDAFLAAESWAVRNAYVRNPDAELEDMEALSTRFGDGAIETSEIAFLVANPGENVFRVQVPGLENPFPVSVIEGDGMWKVDWKTFAEFYYDRFEDFATGEAEASEMTFHLQIKPAPDESDPLAPARVMARAPHASEGHQLTLDSDSPARQDLARLFRTYHEQRPEVLQHAFDTGGLPLVVTVARPGGENSSLRLEEIVSNTWMNRDNTE